jgi:hypothetical protein
VLVVLYPKKGAAKARGVSKRKWSETQGAVLSSLLSLLDSAAKHSTAQHSTLIGLGGTPSLSLFPPPWAPVTLPRGFPADALLGCHWRGSVCSGVNKAACEVSVHLEKRVCLSIHRPR